MTKEEFQYEEAAALEEAHAMVQYYFPEGERLDPPRVYPHLAIGKHLMTSHQLARPFPYKTVGTLTLVYRDRLWQIRYDFDPEFPWDREGLLGAVEEAVLGFQEGKEVPPAVYSLFDNKGRAVDYEAEGRPDA